MAHHPTPTARGRHAFGAALALLALFVPTPAAAQTVRVAVVTERQLPPFLRDEVLILGGPFPGRTFQRAVLAGLRAGRLRARVVTGAGNARYFMPLRKVGGVVRTFDGTLMGAVAVTGDAVIVPQGSRYRVVTGPGVTASVTAQFENAWRYAR
ncbi:hypothetical protein [Deinococcus pimensis]|uniref:hypothetical protein n=1 Tax=Deinococcus pimensis TaxID=309888 RepID=UPI00048022B1|nr:hypothetical protein [Deinococcus pimensis]